MAERILSDQNGQDIGSLAGLLLCDAVARGAILMAKITEGTSEHEKWSYAASQAVPLVSEHLDQMRTTNPSAVSEGESDIEAEQLDGSKIEKLARILALEEEASRLRTELEA